MASALEQFKTYLKTQGFSTTAPRLAVFKALVGHEPQTISEIIKRTAKIDRASVYRTIALFESLAIVKRLNIGWKYKLELSDMFNQHHHHLTCLNCDLIIPLTEDKQMETYIRILAAHESFKPQDHELEIRGLCKDCRTK